ncbi:MAG: STAS domain-containing protein, partial [Gaiellaceae bacterium]
EGNSRASMDEPGREPADAFRIVEEHPDGETFVLAIHGDADLKIAAGLKDRLGAAIDDESVSTLVLDLSGVTFLDSMVLGVFLGCMKRLRARGGRFRVVMPHGDIRRIFEMTLLDRVFELDESREEALTATATRDA